MNDSSGSRVTILLVEDNPIHVRLIQHLLADSKTPIFHLITSGSLAEAYAQIGQHAIDLVMLDLTLPDSQDLDTFVRLRGHAPDVPIVIVTSLDDVKLAARAVEAGAQDYLVKSSLNRSALSRSLR